jgi:O-succinylbenzoic acid--CoA ligase
MEPTENAVDWESEENTLFLNPRFADEIQSHYNRVFRETAYRHGLKSHLGFLTSGTTVTDQKAYKMVFISKKAFINSATSVAKTLMVTSKDIWAQSLPRFHVGGLAIEARSSVAGFKVEKYTKPWSAKDFVGFIDATKSTWSSLVPTQIYDIVKAQIVNPRAGKFRVLVGGARLSPGLLKQAQDLKWNLIPSYGMTEAGSTLAFIENETLRPFPHVMMEVIDGKLGIKTNSLFTFYAQVLKGQIEIKRPTLTSNGFFMTEDSASKMRQGIMLLGRTQDVVKISGELTSLPKLRDIFFGTTSIDKAHSYYLLATPDPRLENKVVLVIQKDLLSNDKVKSANYQLAPAFVQSLAEFHKKVLPFEKVHNIFVVDKIPRTETGKVQERAILQMIEKGEAHEIRDYKLE